MKKLFFALVVVSTAFCYSCQSNTVTVEKKNETNNTVQTVDVPKDEKVTAEPEQTKIEAATGAQTSESKAAAEMCACMNASLKDVSPRVQQVFIRAGNSERPLDVLRNEVVAMSDKEQEELMVQLQRFSSDPKLQDCSGTIFRKYGLDPDDKTTQDRILQATKANKDCELVSALVKIGMQQQTGNGN